MLQKSGRGGEGETFPRGYLSHSALFLRDIDEQRCGLFRFREYCEEFCLRRRLNVFFVVGVLRMIVA